MQTVELGPENGTLTLSTGVEGSAARMGHALTLEFEDWRATVDFNGETPVAVDLTIHVASLQVVRASGGLKPLSDGDRRAIVKNAVGVLDAERQPTASFTSTSLVPAGQEYTLSGTATIAGVDSAAEVRVVAADAGDHWNVTAETTIRHSDFGLKPYSTMLGALRVSDAVQIVCEAAIGK